MSTENFSILLCTNGHQSTQPALEYGAWLAGILDKPVTLLGLDEAPEFKLQLSEMLEQASARLIRQNIRFTQVIEAGSGAVAIARLSQSGSYLTVVGPLGRPLWQRVVQGRSYRRLLAKIDSPILYVPNARLPLRHILVCTGGLGYALSLERLSLLIAKVVGARVTLLHVVEPISLEYPTAVEIQHHADDILDSDTPQAKNLKQALAEICSAGLEAELKIRQGSIVHEILEEIHAGDYDLVGLGSQYSTKSLRHYYTPNVTAEVAETIHIPVLSVRGDHA
jgi:nucleotide-binding universal stress UspA family protein